MNKQNKYMFLQVLAMVGVLFSSCEKYLEFDEETTTSKLVLNGELKADSIVKIHISSSLSVIDAADLTHKTDATVSVYNEDGSLFENLTHQFNGLYQGTLIPNENENYTVEVSAPNYETINATDYIPSETILTEVDTASFTAPGSDYQELEITLKFEDDPSKMDYYKLEVYTGDIVSGNVYLNQQWIRSNDVALNLSDEEFHPEVHFTDELFDGETKSLVIYVDDSRDYDAFLELRLTSLTEAGYLYEKTYAQFEMSKYNPFAQPVQVYNNVNEGFGILKGENLNKRKINF